MEERARSDQTNFKAGSALLTPHAHEGYRRTGDFVGEEVPVGTPPVPVGVPVWGEGEGGKVRADASRKRMHFWPCLRGSEVNAIPRAWHPLTRKGRASCNVRDTVQRARHSEMLRAVRERAGAAHRGPETLRVAANFIFGRASPSAISLLRA